MEQLNGFVCYRCGHEAGTKGNLVRHLKKKHLHTS